jgi:hypothetical protein
MALHPMIAGHDADHGNESHRKRGDFLKFEFAFLVTMTFASDRYKRSASA